MPAMKFQFTYVIHPIQRKYYIGMYNRMYQVPKYLLPLCGESMLSMPIVPSGCPAIANS